MAGCWKRFGCGLIGLFAALIICALSGPLSGAPVVLAAGPVFAAQSAAMPPASRAMPSATPASIPDAAHRLQRAMWVWDTKALLEHPGRRARLFAVGREYRISVIFLQALYRIRRGKRGVSCVLRQPRALASFIAQAHAGGIKVHALDGYPEFALDAYHPQVLALVEALLAWNVRHPHARFDGIHFDNEPYLLIGFDGPLRDTILNQYLELNRKVMDLLRRAAAAPSYGVDAPFWFASTQFAYRGVQASMAEHLLGIVDNVGVMDYRAVARGPNGIIAHARRWISDADRLGKGVYIGVETTRAAPRRVDFIYGPTQQQWNAPGKKEATLMLRSRLDDFQMRVIDDGAGRDVGLVVPRGGPAAAFIAALARLTDVFGSPGTVRDVLAALRRYPEYGEFRPASWRSANDRLVKGFTVTETTPRSITFAGLGKQRLMAALAQTARAFAGNRAMLGFAIHDFRGLSRLGDN